MSSRHHKDCLGPTGPRALYQDSGLVVVAGYGERTREMPHRECSALDQCANPTRLGQQPREESQMLSKTSTASAVPSRRHEHHFRLIGPRALFKDGGLVSVAGGC